LPTTEVNGARIYFEEQGEGFPLVLLHPWPTDHAMWMFQVPVFAESYRVITPDSRGLGSSEKKGDYSLATLARDVEGLLSTLGVRRAFVVGSSLGASVAQKLTIDYPDMVQAAVWVGAPTYPLGDLLFEGEIGQNRPFVGVYLEALNSGGYSHFWRTIWKPTMHYQFHDDFVRSGAGSYLIRYLFEERYARLNEDPSGVIQIIEALDKEKPMLDQLKSVSSKVPCALVTGDGDDTRPACEAQHEALPKVDFLLVNRAGHFCFMDQPGQFNGFLHDFLRRNGP
jgi:pimeloyl-ACP methyl ester carboxylesterase